jgi:hypothetical protein
LLLGGFVYLVPSASRAQDLSYREWRFGVGSGVAPLSDELIQSLHAQIDIVESLDIRPEIKTFFRTVPLEIDKTTTGGAGAYSFREHRMFLSAHVDSPENPVFLHELLHAYHDLKLPDGVRNRRIIETYEDAQRNHTFRTDAYMMKNEKEFFAMCASVVLWGRAARPPSTRETVREKLPGFYDWIVAEFGFKHHSG